MAQTYTDTNVNSLVINKLTKQEYDNLPSHSATELYLVPETVDSTVTENSTNPVQSGAVYQALQNNHDVIMVYFAHNKAYTVSLTDAYYDTTDEELVAQDPATWTGQVPQLPIITAGYYYDLLTGKIYYIENEGDLPVEVTDVEIQGDTSKLYIDLNTSKAYRWNGSTFVLLAAGGNYNDLTNKPQNATTTTAGLMSAEDKSILIGYFKEIIINQLSTIIPANTPIGLVKISNDAINIDIKTYGMWNVATMGQLNFCISGRSQYGYGIVQSGANFTRTNLIVKCGLKNNQVYIWVVFPDSSYNSTCNIVIYGYGAYYAQSLDYAILDESEFSKINYLNINAI